MIEEVALEVECGLRWFSAPQLSQTFEHRGKPSRYMGTILVSRLAKPNETDSGFSWLEALCRLADEIAQNGFYRRLRFTSRMTGAGKQETRSQPFQFKTPQLNEKMWESSVHAVTQTHVTVKEWIRDFHCTEGVVCAGTSINMEWPTA